MKQDHKITLTLTVSAGSRKTALAQLVRVLYGGRKHIKAVEVDDVMHPREGGSFVPAAYEGAMSKADQEKQAQIPGWKWRATGRLSVDKILARLKESTMQDLTKIAHAAIDVMEEESYNV